MKKILFALTLQMLALTLVHAQQIKGVVRDEKGNVVSAATVSLLNARDQSVVKLALTNKGAFHFDLIKQDSFLVGVSYVGYQPVFSQKFAFKGETITLPDLIFKTPVSSMQGITVVARKPIVEVKADKTVLNVEGTINATGSDALELLRKSPGVLVDNDENLSVNGKSGVQVYIDGKPTPLNGQDLSSYLKTIPSSQIEAVEIIQNPGASFEASGSAGIINIRLKKGKTMGFNGNVNAGISASKYLRAENGFSLNYRNKNFNVFGTYNGNYGKLESAFELHRVVKDTAFDQQNQILVKRNNHTFKTGLDYTLSAKSNIGVLVTGNFSSPQVTNTNVTPISHYPTGTVDRILKAGNDTRQRNHNINTNVNYSFKDSAGRSMVVNADYGYYNNKQDQAQPNTFYDATGKNELYQRNYTIASPTRIDIYALKVDYEQPFAKGRLGIGGKVGYVKTANDFRQYNEGGRVRELDRERSNFFGYKENVNAAYINYSKEWKGIAVQGGIRAEQTDLEGTLKSYKRTGGDYPEVTANFKRDYIDFFPSISITLAPKTGNQFALAYSRKIDRPVYKNLNPFEYRINEYTFHKGSIHLRPQYSNTVSLTHTYKYKLNTTLSYSHIKDVFGQLVDTAHGMKGYLVNSNIASQDIASLNISYPFQYKNYSLFTNINTFYSRNKADYGTHRNINLDTWTINIYAQNSYRFGKGWSAEVSGFYASPSIWQGTMKAAAMWSADAGVQKQILSGKGTIKASVSDVFKSMQWSANSNFARQAVAVAGRYESRQYKLHFTYRFGNNKIKAARQYNTGLEDELNRTQSSGGLGHQ